MPGWAIAPSRVVLAGGGEMDDSGEWIHLYAEEECEEAAPVGLGAVVATTRAAWGLAGLR